LERPLELARFLQPGGATRAKGQVVLHRRPRFTIERGIDLIITERRWNRTVHCVCLSQKWIEPSFENKESRIGPNIT
jgi:hypothetical protein